MFNFLSLSGSHEVDNWRDDYTLAAAATLNDLAVELLGSCEDELKAATWTDGLIGQAGFIATRITPKIHETARPVVDHIIERANSSLARLVDQQATWSYAPACGTTENHASGGWQDVAVAAGPLAGGVAVAAALPAMAVTTSTAFFGLVTTTAISWPIVLGGGALAGVAIATGLVNTGQIWDKTEARLRSKVREHVVAVLLKGSSRHPSILEQLTKAFAAAAEKARAA